MRDPTDKVEIVDPPIGELTKKPGGLKRTCLTGCGCIMLFIIALIAILWVIIGSGPKTLRSLPANFPETIPLYDQDNMEKITFISGRYKSRGIEIAAFFPKIIFSPLLLQSDPTTIITSTTQNNVLSASTISLKKIWKLVRTPIGDKRDTIQIEWRDLDVEPRFLISYYQKELSKKNYSLEIHRDQDNLHEISFSQKNGPSGLLTIKSDEKNKLQTAFALLTVHLPLATSTSP